MAKKPDIWMPLYIGDYLAATAHLDAQESGAYLHLLMHSWKNGSLPSEPEALRRICRISADAWSNAWAVLKPFFDFAEDGTPSQGRLEKIRGEWSGKKEKATEKAHKAAEARWSRDASSNAQAMHKPCPSPSPTPTNTKQNQKPYRGKRDPDLRHVPFKLACQTYAKHKGATFVWDGSDAKQLGLLLAAAPELTIEGFQRCLNNRARSPAVLHGDRPRMYLGTILSFQQSAVNQFKQPEGTGNGEQKGKSGQTVDAGRDFLKGFADRLGLGEDGNPPASAESVAGGLRGVCGGSFALPLG